MKLKDSQLFCFAGLWGNCKDPETKNDSAPRFPNNSAQPHLALWLDSPEVQSGLALRLDLGDLRKAHFLKPIRNRSRPRVYLVLAYARHSTVASPLGPPAAARMSSRPPEYTLSFSS
jgi:hypothetical protein